MSRNRCGARAALALAAGAAAYSSASAQTVYDGRIIVCETEYIELYAGSQISSYAFHGDGAVVMQIDRGALDCSDGGAIGALPLGEAGAYSYRCARIGTSATGAEIEIAIEAEGVTSVDVDGAVIRGFDEKSVRLVYDGLASTWRDRFEEEIVCDGDVCRATVWRLTDQGREFGLTMECELRSLAGV